MHRLLSLICLILATLPVEAQERRALLIGNQAYALQVGALTNPINDVNLVAASLRRIGFTSRNITIVKNGNRRTILRAIDRHAKALKAAGPDAIGFLYYSGHGAANNQNRRNYLIPVGVKRLDADVWYDSIPLDEIVSSLKELSANAAHFVVFDACRNLLNLPTKGGKGFVPVATRRGMLIAFSTDPGQTASDHGQGSGPYAAALAAELVKPGVDHLDLFQNVKETVYAKTRVQVPWTRDGMLQRVYLGGRVASNSQPAAALNPAARDWQIVKDTKNAVALRAFAKRYKGTVFADMATAMATNMTGTGTVAPKVRLTPPGVLFKKRSPKRPGQTFRDCPACPAMVVVPAGKFLMGSIRGGKNERPKHKVTIPKAFAVGKYEVTFDEWDACVADGACRYQPKDEGWGRGLHPVIHVSWNQITNQFLPWLSKRANRTYRLLTEAEWEYAARAGSRQKYPWGQIKSLVASRAYANYGIDDCCGGIAQGADKWINSAPVGQLLSNKFGLHDMIGNVYEWVQDCYVDRYTSAPADGRAVTTGGCARHSVRGGSWISGRDNIRTAARGFDAPGNASVFVGFRVARDLP